MGRERARVFQVPQAAFATKDTALPTSHPRPWRKNSQFGPGRRVPLDRERRAVWRARLVMHRRAGRLTALHEDIGLAMLRRLSQEEGRLDPSHATLADDAGASVSTVQRALVALRACGLVDWDRRLVRSGWRTEQTSNAYALSMGNAPVVSCDSQNDRETRKRCLPTTSQPIMQVDPAEHQQARAVLARITEQRQASILTAWTARGRQGRGS
jgi:hypothetical protein